MTAPTSDGDDDDLAYVQLHADRLFKTCRNAGLIDEVGGHQCIRRGVHLVHLCVCGQKWTIE